MSEADEQFSPRRRHAITVEYLQMKVNERDWHGVSDAANDLRELEAAYPELFVEQDRKGWPREGHSGSSV